MDELTRLWLAARDGDDAALIRAIRSSQGDVYRLTVHLVGAADAEDVTQDIFVRAWRALPAFRGDSSARTWLLAIARRACADAVRRSVRQRKVRVRLELDHGRGGGGADTGRVHALRALVDGLDRDQRVAFVLTQMVGCSYAQAAEICAVPIGTIRSRVARAREHLVAELEASEAG
jgi:RNA polymerase sigma-70 factor (ECF subfamily)